MGDSANTASRVEGLNKYVGTQVLATGDVIEGFDNLLTRYLGDFQFVGKTDAVPIYEVLASDENATDQQHRLCEAFDASMTLYRDANWTEAARQLEEMLEAHAQDGPAKFFLARCQRFMQNSDPTEDPRIVRMAAK